MTMAEMQTTNKIIKTVQGQLTLEICHQSLTRVFFRSVLKVVTLTRTLSKATSMFPPRLPPLSWEAVSRTSLACSHRPIRQYTAAALYNTWATHHNYTFQFLPVTVILLLSLLLCENPLTEILHHNLPQYGGLYQWINIHLNNMSVFPNLLSEFGKKNSPCTEVLRHWRMELSANSFSATKAKKQHYYSSSHQGDMSVHSMLLLEQWFI